MNSSHLAGDSLNTNSLQGRNSEVALGKEYNLLACKILAWTLSVSILFIQASMHSQIAVMFELASSECFSLENNWEWCKTAWTRKILFVSPADRILAKISIKSWVKSAKVEISLVFLYKSFDYLWNKALQSFTYSILGSSWIPVSDVLILNKHATVLVWT